MSGRRAKLIFIPLGVLLLAGLVAAQTLLHLDAFLPHKKIQIIMPFDAQYDNATSMIPMGETIFHPKPQVPNGHPGIDFVSQQSFPFIASADGKITKMILGGSSDGIDITLTSGAYNIVYKEMDPDNVFVKMGQQVKQGGRIAMPNPKRDPEHAENVHYSTHWEFASASPIRDRFCPLTYFTAESRARIEAIWDTVKPTDFQNTKQQFPYICSGDYYNRTE